MKHETNTPLEWFLCGVACMGFIWLYFDDWESTKHFIASQRFLRVFCFILSVRFLLWLGRRGQPVARDHRSRDIIATYELPNGTRYSGICTRTERGTK